MISSGPWTRLPSLERTLDVEPTPQRRRPPRPLRSDLPARRGLDPAEPAVHPELLESPLPLRDPRDAGGPDVIGAFLPIANPLPTAEHGPGAGRRFVADGSFLRAAILQPEEDRSDNFKAPIRNDDSNRFGDWRGDFRFAQCIPGSGQGGERAIRVFGVRDSQLAGPGVIATRRDVQFECSSGDLKQAEPGKGGDCGKATHLEAVAGPLRLGNLSGTTVFRLDNPALTEKLS